MPGSGLRRARRGRAVLLVDETMPSWPMNERNDDPRIAAGVATPLRSRSVRALFEASPREGVDGATPTNAGWLEAAIRHSAGHRAGVIAYSSLRLAVSGGAPHHRRRGGHCGLAPRARDATTVICHRPRNLARETRAPRSSFRCRRPARRRRCQPTAVNRRLGITPSPRRIVGDVEFATVPRLSAISPSRRSVPGDPRWCCVNGEAPSAARRRNLRRDHPADRDATVDDPPGASSVSVTPKRYVPTAVRKPAGPQLAVASSTAARESPISGWLAHGLRRREAGPDSSGSPRPGPAVRGRRVTISGSAAAARPRRSPPAPAAGPRRRPSRDRRPSPAPRGAAARCSGSR